jgi:hypothetical protein
MKIFRRIAVGAILICLIPFAAALLAELIGGVFGCQVDMGGVIWPCPVAGIDIGSALQTIYSFSYGTFFTVPLLLLTLAVWGVVELFHLLRVGVHGEPRR